MHFWSNFQRTQQPRFPVLFRRITGGYVGQAVFFRVLKNEIERHDQQMASDRDFSHQQNHLEFLKRLFFSHHNNKIRLHRVWAFATAK